MLLGYWACNWVPTAAGSAAGLLPADNLPDEGDSPLGHPTHEARDCPQQTLTPVKHNKCFCGLQIPAAYGPCQTASRGKAGAKQKTYPKGLALKDLLAALLVCECDVIWLPKSLQVTQQLKEDTAHAEDISCRGDQIFLRLPEVVQTLWACIGWCSNEASPICKSATHVLAMSADEGQVMT